MRLRSMSWRGIGRLEAQRAAAIAPSPPRGEGWGEGVWTSLGALNEAPGRTGPPHPPPPPPSPASGRGSNTASALRVWEGHASHRYTTPNAPDTAATGSRNIRRSSLPEPLTGRPWRRNTLRGTL